MEFARKQLQKYGWVEGQGLGKNEDGIARPIKIGIKSDNAGVGVAPGEEFASHWWSSIFNKAAGNISVENKEDGVVIQTRSEDETSQSLKKRHYGEHRNSLLYGGFLQSTSTIGDEEKTRTQHSCSLPCNTVTEGRGDGRISDEELWNACGRRTAHKAARHGFNLSGKLKRIEDQEKLMLNRAKHKELAVEIGSPCKEEQFEADSSWHKPCKKKCNTCGVRRRVLSVRLEGERSRDAAEQQKMADCSLSSRMEDDGTPLLTRAPYRCSDGDTSPSEVVKKPRIPKPKKRKRIK